MSAFVVADTTINRIVSYLEHDRDAGGWYRDKIGQALHMSRFDPLTLAQAMAALNVEAVNQRYRENETSAGFRYEYEVPGTKIQVLKALRCWLYQCSEGDVPEHELFKVLTEYAGELAMDIVRDLPEWDRAEWG